jgi:hypothetical protein
MRLPVRDQVACRPPMRTIAGGLLVSPAEPSGEHDRSTTPRATRRPVKYGRHRPSRKGPSRSEIVRLALTKQRPNLKALTGHTTRFLLLGRTNRR